MKVALISGGASGIGLASAQKFMAQGYHVIVLDIRNNSSAFKDFDPERFCFFQVDVTNTEEVETALAKITERFDRIDVVVTSAGMYLSNTVESMSREEFQSLVETNCYGSISVIQAALPYLKQSDGASIVLVASDQASFVKHNSFAYAATKGIVAQMTKSMALDLAQYGVRVNAVCPGTIKTPMVDGFVRRWAEDDFQGDESCLWQKIANEYPMKRVGQPEEVANAVYFLASSEASFVTGVLLPVDGGLTLSVV